MGAHTDRHPLILLDNPAAPVALMPNAQAGSEFDQPAPGQATVLHPLPDEPM